MGRHGRVTRSKMPRRNPVKRLRRATRSDENTIARLRRQLDEAREQQTATAEVQFTPEIHWQVAAGDLVTTYKTYHGTHQGEFLGIPATGKKVSFYTVDAMRVVDGKITEH
jgi:predicted ester cyclase